MTSDTCVTISPHFRVPDERLDGFTEVCRRFVEAVAADEGCVRYSWGFDLDGHDARFREDFVDADAVLAHFASVAGLTEEISQTAELVSLEVLGPADELAKLRPFLTEPNHHLFAIEAGFHR
jgi:quinol monooxygenase YgiN